MDHFCCFSQSSMASLTAMPKAPFLPPYFRATFDLNSRSMSLGSITTVFPIINTIYFCQSLYLYIHVPKIFLEIQIYRRVLEW